jgi:hypothetical protein
VRGKENSGTHCAHFEDWQTATKLIVAHGGAA